MWSAVHYAHRAAGLSVSDAAARALAVARSMPAPADVHVDGPLGERQRRKPKKPKPDQPEDVPAAKALATVVKIDDEMRVVWGWASVIEEGGRPVIDLQGDMISEKTLVAAAHGFAGVRAIKAMHGGEDVGTLVESVVLTRALQKALGIDLGKVGWLIAAKIEDDAAWAKVKSGDFPAFSIGGTAEWIDV